MANRAFSIKGLRSVGTIGLILVTSSAHAIGYLAKVGPTSLRLQPVRQRNATLPPIGANQPVTNADGDTSANILHPPFKPTPNLQTEAFTLPGSPLAASLNEINPDTVESKAMIPQPVISSGPSSAANDLLVITPQMLVEYFKPMAGTTNGTGTAVVVPVTFTPPAPTAEKPSSRAIYKTQ